MKELIEIQARLKAPKSKYNTYGKYHYRSLEDILEAVKPLLKELNCSLLIYDDLALIGDWHYIKSVAVLTNSEGETAKGIGYAREDPTKAGMSLGQITGSNSSYARKYALNGLFLIDDTKDPDTDELKVEGEAKAKKAAKAKATSLDDAITKMTAATNRAEFEAAWKAYPEFHKDTKFLECASTIGKKFPKQQQQTLDV